MSAHVLLNSLNDLRKSNKMLGLQSLLSFFHYNFNKLNKTKSTNVRFYLSHDIKLLKTCFFFACKCQISPSFTQGYIMDVNLLCY